MTYLVTGGAGFIGSHLADRLVADGHEVIVLDSLETGSMGNIAHLLDEELFEFWEGSILDEPLMAALIARVDVVFHLAAVVGVKRILQKTIQTIETNVHGTEIVLRAASTRGTLVCLGSTSEVYGKSATFKEDSDLVLGCKARWNYACTKLLDEYLALAYHREQGLPVVITRFFNTIGPRQSGNYGMVVPTFINQGLAGGDITVYGSGDQKRCFMDVADAVESLVRLVYADAAVGEIFNVGNDVELSINDLALQIQAKTGGEIIHLPYGDVYGPEFEDLDRRVPDNSKLEAVTGFRPNIPIGDTLDRILKEL